MRSLSLRIALFLVAAILIGVGLSRMQFNADVLDLMPAELKEIEALRLYQTHFEGRDELMVTLSGSTPETLEEAAASLATVINGRSDLAKRVIWRAPWSDLGGDAAELLAFYWLNQTPENFGELADRMTPGETMQATLAQAIDDLTSGFSAERVARASYDPLGLSQLPEGAGAAAGRGSRDIFASEDGSVRVLYVHRPPVDADYEKGVDWLEALQEAVVGWQTAEPAFADVRVGYTGNPVFVAEISSGMREDMSSSIGITLAIIALLFWLVYRRFSPLLILVGVLVTILAATLGLSGLMLGTINAVSVGFAAILVGLTADYGLILYQEASRFPHRTAAELRKNIAPSIYWAALTTAAVFGALQISSFRGISQLGALVALGTVLGAGIMLYVFLPVWVWRHRTWLKEHVPDRVHTLGRFSLKRRPALWLTAILGIGAVILLLATGLPKVDGSADTLRPSRSQAFATLDLVQKSFGKGRESVFMLIREDTSAAVREHLQELDPVLARLTAENKIAGYSLPLGIWPDETHQSANSARARQLHAQLPEILSTLQETGFQEEAVEFTEIVVQQMAALAARPAPFWPEQPTSRWAVEKVAVHPEQTTTADQFIALGLVYPHPESTRESLQAAFGDQEILMTNWRFLGPAILETVERDLTKLMAIMSVVLLGMLWFVFRRVSEVALSLATLGLSCLLLLAGMKILGLEWNLMNLMAIPLMMGAGLDYSIHLQLALQRHDGSLRETFKGIGLALLLCGASTTTGFLSLAWATNNGLVSLGKVCALGITITAAVAVFLLPAWWQLVHPDETLE